MPPPLPSPRLPRRALLGAPWLVTATADASRFEDELADFARADAAAPSPAGALLFVGSSTIRMWPALARRFAPTPVIQRGFGGSTLAEVHHHRARLFAPHRPAAVILYAGENDVAEGATASEVVDRWRGLGRDLAGTPAGAAPVVFVELKPSPARFELWPRMRAVNAAMRRLDDHRPAAFVDTAAFVLDREGGPRPELFVDDQLHFAERGYVHLTRAVGRALVEIGLTRISHE
jgi:lysophospholipase L1-like esterase